MFIQENVREIKENFKYKNYLEQ